MARRSLAAAAALAALVSCTGSPAPRAPVASETGLEPTPTLASPLPRAPEPHPVSLAAMMERPFDGRAFRVGRVLARTDGYTRHFVTYRSGDLTISGIMNVPDGRGPFPVLILNHGYHPVDVYTNGRGLSREQDYLARAGYVVVHPDYRNHAQSDDDPTSDVRLRLGYTEDVINAVLALRRARLRYVDATRVGMLGRSMGGGVTLNVAVVRPNLVDAVVLYAPVSSDAVDNFERWIRGPADRRALARAIIRRYGEPERAPAFWRGVSPRTYFDRVAVPVQVHHGIADDTCPIAWTHETMSALRDADVRARLFTYPGEGHEFGPAWPTSIARTAAFFDRHL